jgi:uncharacterized membrane protein YagU involved in acid resistance
MNIPRYFAAAAAGAVVFAVVQFFGASVYMHPEYEETRLLWRPPDEALAPLVLLASAVYGLIFTLIFCKGYQARGLGEGLRFGIYATWLVVVPHVLFQYAHQPIPGMLAAKWLALGLGQNMAVGAVVALLYRARPAAEAGS